MDAAFLVELILLNPSLMCFFLQTFFIPGLRNVKSQISSSFSPTGDFIISASEDSRVLVWNSTNRDVSNKTYIYRRDKQLSCEEFTSRHVSVAIAWPDSSTRLSSSRSAYESLGRTDGFASVQDTNEPEAPPPQRMMRMQRRARRSTPNALPIA
jgi:WD40 repeat protein